MRAFAFAAVVAAAAAQSSPVVRTDGGSLVSNIPMGDSITNLVGGKVQARRAGEATIGWPAMQTMVNAKISNMTAAVSMTAATISSLRNQLAAQQSRLAAGAGVTAEVDQIQSQVMATTAAARARNARNTQATRGLRQLLAASSSIGSSLLPDTQSRLTALDDTVTARLAASASSTDAAVERSESQIEGSVSSQLAASLTRINSQMAVVSPISAKMATTHYMNPAIPVYRWMMFHVYSNNGVGWFDGNNIRHFGGRHPSQWGDGNTVVWDMDANIPAIARLFTRRGVGTPLGATVCSETWYLFSSTDTKYCVALFRIKNTRTAAIQWRWNWHGTGWSGWGNQQSMTNSRQQNWAGSCTWWCHRAYTFTIQANAQRNRISTLIFANGMTHPNHYADNHHIETTFLGFDGLVPPSGLEFVDDLSVATGRWR